MLLWWYFMNNWCNTVTPDMKLLWFGLYDMCRDILSWLLKFLIDVLICHSAVIIIVSDWSYRPVFYESDCDSKSVGIWATTRSKVKVVVFMGLYRAPHVLVKQNWDQHEPESVGLKCLDRLFPGSLGWVGRREIGDLGSSPG